MYFLLLLFRLKERDWVSRESKLFIGGLLPFKILHTKDLATNPHELYEQGFPEGYWTMVFARYPGALEFIQSFV